MSKIDKQLFSVSQDAIDNVYGQCPECQSALQFKRGKSGTFLGCSKYPDCSYTHNLGNSGTETLKVIDGSQCPECGDSLAVKKGRYGMFIGCTAFPDCHYVNTEKANNPPSEESVTCPKCQKGDLLKRKGRTGQAFYSCDGYPKCKYIVNDLPVAKQCPECQWPIMVQKRTELGIIVECPQKSCHAKLSSD